MKRVFLLCLGLFSFVLTQAVEVKDEWSGLELDVPDGYTVEQENKQANGVRFVVKGADGNMVVYYFDANRKNDMEWSASDKTFTRRKVKNLDKLFFELENPVYAEKTGFLDLAKTEWEYHYLAKPEDTDPTICTRYYWRDSRLYCFVIQDKNGNFQPYKDIIDASEGLQWGPIAKFMSLDWVYIIILVMLLACLFVGLLFCDEAVKTGHFWRDLKEAWVMLPLSMVIAGVSLFLVRSDMRLVLLLGGVYVAWLVISFIRGLVKSSRMPDGRA